MLTDISAIKVRQSRIFSNELDIILDFKKLHTCCSISDGFVDENLCCVVIGKVVIFVDAALCVPIPRPN
jgi:hypothetical protein